MLVSRPSGRDGCSRRAIRHISLSPSRRRAVATDGGRFPSPPRRDSGRVPECVPSESSSSGSFKNNEKQSEAGRLTTTPCLNLLVKRDSHLLVKKGPPSCYFDFPHSFILFHTSTDSKRSSASKRLLMLH